MFLAMLAHKILSDLMVFRLGAHRRSEVEIICDILETCLDGAVKTSVVYRANLNFTRLNKYMNMLLGLGYISLSVVCGEGNKNDMRIGYCTTEQGKGFLAKFVNMQKLSHVNEAAAKPLISRFPQVSS
jgi:predicted transcriptional regulator